MNETNQAPSPGGTKLSTIFMVVLGLHIVVIVVITAFYVMKGRNHPEMADSTTPAITEGMPAITSDTPQAPGSTSAEPVLETNTAPMISQEMIGTMADAAPASPMPATTDPVWSTAPSEMPEQPTHQPELAPMAELQTPPARLEMDKPAAAAPAKKAPVAAVSKAKTVQVVAGDNLTKIAKKNNTTVAKLKQANGLAGDTLKIGQVLKVPGSAAPAVAKTPAKKSSPIVASTPSAATSYQVVKGDTLWKIAKSFGVSPTVLAQTNGLSDPGALKIGSTLKIPRSAATKAAPKAAPVREAEASVPAKKPFREPVITMDMARL